MFAQPPAGAEPSGKVDGAAPDERSGHETRLVAAERDAAASPSGSSSTGPLGLLAGALLIAGIGLGALRLGGRLATRRSS